MHETETIKLSFPMNAAYISSARLTASSIASRRTFDIDEIEDIKSAVSETCTFLLRSLPITVKSNFDITFILREDEMEIKLETSASSLEKKNDMSLMMIKALVDEFTISEDSPVTITMVKRHKEFILG